LKFNLKQKKSKQEKQDKYFNRGAITRKKKNDTYVFAQKYGILSV